MRVRASASLPLPPFLSSLSPLTSSPSPPSSCTCEEVEEGSRLRRSLAVNRENIEPLLVNEHFAKEELNLSAQGCRQPIGADGAKDATNLERAHVSVIAWRLGLLRSLQFRPLFPMFGTIKDILLQLAESGKFRKPADRLPHTLIDEGCGGKSVSKSVTVGQ